MYRLKMIIDKIDDCLIQLDLKKSSNLSASELYFKNILSHLLTEITLCDYSDSIEGLKAALIFLEEVGISLPSSMQSNDEKSSDKNSSDKNSSDEKSSNVQPTSSEQLSTSSILSLASLRSGVAGGINLAVKSSSLISFGYFSGSMQYLPSLPGFLSSGNTAHQIADDEVEMKVVQVDSVGLDLKPIKFKSYLLNQRIEVSQEADLANVDIKCIPVPDNKEGSVFITGAELETLTSIYSLMRYFYPKWTHVFEKDSEGYISQKEINEWFLKSQNSAMRDFKRDVRILNESGGSEEDCYYRILQLVAKMDCSDSDKALYAKWISKKGGQDCNFDPNTLDPNLPINGGGKSVYTNWYIEDGKPCFRNILHVNIVQHKIHDEMQYTIMKFDGFVGTFNAMDMAEERLKFMNIKSIAPPILNFDYKIMLKIVNGAVVPYLVQAQLHSYTNYLQLLKNNPVTFGANDKNGVAVQFPHMLQAQVDEFVQIEVEPRSVRIGF